MCKYCIGSTGDEQVWCTFDGCALFSRARLVWHVNCCDGFNFTSALNSASVYFSHEQDVIYLQVNTVGVLVITVCFSFAYCLWFCVSRAGIQSGSTPIVFSVWYQVIWKWNGHLRWNSGISIKPHHHTMYHHTAWLFPGTRTFQSQSGSLNLLWRECWKWELAGWFEIFSACRWGKINIRQVQIYKEHDSKLAAVICNSENSQN